MDQTQSVNSCSVSEPNNFLILKGSATLAGRCLFFCLRPPVSVLFFIFIFLSQGFNRSPDCESFQRKVVVNDLFEEL